MPDAESALETSNSLQPISGHDMTVRRNLWASEHRFAAVYK